MRVGIVVFGSRAAVAIPLDAHPDKRILQQAVGQIAFLGGDSNLAEGLRVLSSDVSESFFSA